MPTIRWTTENSAWVDGNDTGAAVQEIIRNQGFRHTAETVIVGQIRVELEPPK